MPIWYIVFIYLFLLSKPWHLYCFLRQHDIKGETQLRKPEFTKLSLHRHKVKRRKAEIKKGEIVLELICIDARTRWYRVRFNRLGLTYTLKMRGKYIKAIHNIFILVYYVDTDPGLQSPWARFICMIIPYTVFVGGLWINIWNLGVYPESNVTSWHLLIFYHISYC